MIKTFRVAQREDAEPAEGSDINEIGTVLDIRAETSDTTQDASPGEKSC